MVESHSENEIVNGCINLMWDLVSEFEDYLNFIDVDISQIPKEEQFSVNFSYFEIVQKLFLSMTTHSGGTSTREKCKELGFDFSERVKFKLPTWEENNG